MYIHCFLFFLFSLIILLVHVNIFLSFIFLYLIMFFCLIGCLQNNSDYYLLYVSKMALVFRWSSQNPSNFKIGG